MKKVWLVVIFMLVMHPQKAAAQTNSDRPADAAPKTPINAPIKVRASIESPGPRALTKAELWAIACPALLDHFNGSCHDRLATKAITEENIAAQKALLLRWWRVNNREDLLTNLSRLDSGGHRKYFDEYAKAIKTSNQQMLDQLKARERSPSEFENKLAVCRDNNQQLGSKSLIGWDYCRYIDLCRWGYLCGYLSEEEAWERIMPKARLLQQTFDSWEDLGNNYFIGRAFWSSYISAKDRQALEEIYRGLLTSSTSPWKLYPWNTPL